MENRGYESVQALVRQLHAPSKNVARPHSDTELANPETKRIYEHTLPLLAVDKNRKRSIFDNNFKIPVFTITAPISPESPENMAHRRFSFGIRRHSHTAVRHLNKFYVDTNQSCRINN